MDKEILWKNELIKSLEDENVMLKEQIDNLQKDVVRLERRLQCVEAQAAGSRRGLPWN